MSQIVEQKWTRVIRPKKKLFDVDLKSVWRYRDLVYMYVKRDIVVQYKQTILGPLWYFVQPIMTTIMFMFVFGGIANISTDGMPQPLFYMAGLLLWNYFSSCFTASSDIFGGNAAVFGKVYFPRLVVPLSAIVSNLLKMLIQLALFVFLYVFYVIKGAPVYLNWTLVLFPLLVVMVALHGMSMGLIISSLTTKYRDLKFLISFGVQLLMYATPVIYPLSASPEKYRWLLEINPLTPILEAFKYSCMGCGALNWGGLLYSFIFMIVMLFFGVVIFSRQERNFMDTV
jgi:lipopolysaccharide transport system permease protein